MKRYKGFTLSELMIALAVLGILCATVLPALINNTPNQHKMMMKKAYYTFTDNIKEIINDPGNYPTIEGLCPDNDTKGYVGFDCGTSEKLPYIFSQNVNMEERITGTRASFASNSKYTKSSDADCIGVASSCFALTSSDGVIWTFPKSTFSVNVPTSSILVGVDVNGTRKPNCYQGSSNGSCDKKKNNYDQFRMKLYNDGIIEVNSSDTWAKYAINVSSSLTGND